MAKSVAAAPEIAIALMVREALPLLVSVTVEGVELALTFSAGTAGVRAPSVASAAMPFPLRLTF
jgi:hypothetical protein